MSRPESHNDERSAPTSPLMSASSREDDEESTAFLSEKRNGMKSYQKQRNSPTTYIISIFNILLFAVSCALFGQWYYETHFKLNPELRRAATYSPLHDLLDLEMGPRKVTGTLYPPRDNPSIARQNPNPEADAIWEEYELVRMLPVSSTQLRAMGKDPSTVAKLEDEEWGLGDDAYVAFLDVFHHLHCLNSLRRLAYGDYYTNDTHPHAGSHDHHAGKRAAPDGMHEIHVNHCVDILMQAIMCSGHVGLATMHWVADHPYPFPDMSVNRQCINFDKLTEWRKENTLDSEKYKRVMTKKGREGKIKELHAPDAFYKYYRPDMTNPNHVDGANPGEDFNL